MYKAILVSISIFIISCSSNDKEDIVSDQSLYENNLLEDYELYEKANNYIASNQLDLALMGRLGLIIDGTGRDYDKISYQVRALKELGYDTHMIFVNTSLDVALQRNQMRSRTIPEYIVTRSWNDVQGNIGKFQHLFGPSNMAIIDNNISDKELTTVTMNKCSKAVNRMLTNPIKSYTAKRWIATELRNKRRK